MVDQQALAKVRFLSNTRDRPPESLVRGTAPVTIGRFTPHWYWPVVWESHPVLGIENTKHSRRTLYNTLQYNTLRFSGM